VKVPILHFGGGFWDPVIERLHMQAHQSKKKAMLRKLKLAHSVKGRIVQCTPKVGHSC
jgi:hypothetical protein